MRFVEGIAEIDDLDAFLARVDEIADEYGVTVQAFDARYVVGRGHLERAAELADRAIERDENVARERAVEILLYAAGRRQIDQSLEMGVGEGRRPIVALVDGEGADGEGANGEGVNESNAAGAVADLLEPAATLGEFDRARVREFFGVVDAELAAVDGDLADVVLERVALLDVEK
ncbi:KEOPS complex subunit Cgi121 [Halegenticoccus tardaugens]|uniref:KEOPS complex subunit Cgi121 n=1 Tax=Halegenticoccus tardaugens TaxID=2071624 RepID=UPI00100C3223|nr:KEOPS complex subunit Cgi121 [Halegenticoccus tardaugens]